MTHSFAVVEDSPISGASNSVDKLGRTDFASRIAKTFLLSPRKGSIVISLEGIWGSGKTSTINLIKRALLSDLGDQKPIVFDFNPWMAASAEVMTESFLVQLATAIGLSDRAQEAQDAANQLVGYSGIFTALKFIPGAEPWASLVGSVLTNVGKATASASDLKKLNLEKRRQGVATALKKLHRPIVVFIDDLDRLSHKEVFEMVRVIKAIADFPGLRYVLAFDLAHVVAALSDAGVSRPMEYLEKLIQVRLDLPAIGRRSIEKMLESETAALPPELTEPFKDEDPDRLAWLYHKSLAALVETPRDVKRIFNRLALSGQSLAGEVCFADLFALEVLAVKCPSVYEHIRNQPDKFERIHKNPRSPFDSGAAGQSEPFSEVLAGIQPRFITPVRNLLHELFPVVYGENASREYKKFRSQGRIAAPDKLNVALTIGVPIGELSVARVRDFMSNPPTRKDFVKDLINEETIDNLFHHLEALNSRDVEDVSDFCMWIARIGSSKDAFQADQVRQDTMFVWPTSRKAWSTILNRLLKLPASNRNEIVMTLASSKDDIAVSCEAVAACQRYREGNDARDDYGQPIEWFSKVESSAIIKKWGELHISKLFDKSFSPQEVRPIYLTARFVCPERLRNPAFYKTTVGFERFILTIRHTSIISPGGSVIHISDEHLSEIGDVGEIRRLARQRLGSLPKSAEKLLRAGLMSIANSKAYFVQSLEEAS